MLQVRDLKRLLDELPGDAFIVVDGKSVSGFEIVTGEFKKDDGLGNMTFTRGGDNAPDRALRFTRLDQETFSGDVGTRDL